jgi:hypothetical protein
MEQECQKRYGFHADPFKPKWLSKIEALTTMDTSMLLITQPKNLAFHNLDDTELPVGANDLLGLGLKFCVQRPTPTPEFKDTFARLTCSIRIQQHILGMIETDTKRNYIPSLYINSSWTPPRADEMIEKGLLAFKNGIEAQLLDRKSRTGSRTLHYTG